MSNEIINQICLSVPGMIAEIEGIWLFEMAKKCSKAVVEIGSNTGRSSTCLGCGSKEGNNVPVYCIDPFNGGGATPDPTWGDMADPGTPDKRYYINQGASFDTFWENIKKFGLQNTIHPIIDYSGAAFDKFSKEPIELLFIDGDHRYNYVKLDFDLWEPLLVKGGIIAMHDSAYIGVRKVINEEIIGSKRFMDIQETPIFHARKM